MAKKHLPAALISLAVLAVGATLHFGLPSSPAVAADKGQPTVIELFTSQSCYSCPPAEAYLGELAKRPDILALEFHVDYWDDLVYGSAGKWKDRFSKREYTQRQRGYAARLPRGRVYTPQMVIDGRAFEVGSRKRDVRNTMKKLNKSRGERLNVAVAATSGGFAVNVDGKVSENAGIWFVRFIREETTRVLRGENKGKTLANHHIVTDIQRVGEWRGDALSVTVPAQLEDGQNCAVLVQDDDHGPILGAAACPPLSS